MWAKGSPFLVWPGKKTGSISEALPTAVGGTNASASAKPAEAYPPTPIMLAINAAIRRTANTALADTLSAFIRQLKLAAFCEGG
jgi:hypothetical protein